MLRHIASYLVIVPFILIMGMVMWSCNLLGGNVLVIYVMFTIMGMMAVGLAVMIRNVDRD